MKSRLVVLTMLVLGMLLSTPAPASRFPASPATTPASAQYAQPSPGGGGGVLGDQDSDVGAMRPRPAAAGHSGGEEGSDVQPARQVEAGANNDSNLPFTGFAAIPVLIGGIALLSAGLVLRRRTGDER